MPPEGTTEVATQTNGGADAGQETSVAQATKAGAAASEPWYSGFKDPELKGYAETNHWDGPEAAARDAREAQKLIGVPKAELLRIPKADAKPEDWASFYDKIGRPADPAGYELAKYAPEGVDPALANLMAPTFHQNNVPKQMAHGIAEGFNAAITKLNEEAIQARAAKQADELLSLKREWGGGYDKQEEIARRGFRESIQDLGENDEERQTVMTDIENTIGTRRLLKWFAKMGAATQEDEHVDSQTGSKGFNAATPEGAWAKLEQFWSDTDWVKRRNAGGLAENQEEDRYLRLTEGTPRPSRLNGPR